MNNNVLNELLSFIIGAAISSYITYKILNKKYKNIADEEINSVKEMYKEKTKKAEELDDYIKNDIKNDIKTTYNSVVDHLGYSNKKEEKEENMDNENIEVISPEDFGECGYDTKSLAYFADGVLVDDFTDEIINNTKDIIGTKALTTFGEYEDDSVFVRNHIKRIDYEILLDSRKYSDVFQSNSADNVDNDNQ